jgi:hypothetical protein
VEEKAARFGREDNAKGVAPSAAKALRERTRYGTAEAVP